MAGTNIYIITSVLVLLIILFLIFFIARNKGAKKSEPLSPLVNISFLFVVLGICFGGDSTLGYIFIGAGVILAFVDILRNIRKKGKGH